MPRKRTISYHRPCPKRNRRGRMYIVLSASTLCRPLTLHVAKRFPTVLFNHGSHALRLSRLRAETDLPPRLGVKRNEKGLMCCGAAHKAYWAKPPGSVLMPWELNGRASVVTGRSRTVGPAFFGWNRLFLETQLFRRNHIGSAWRGIARSIVNRGRAKRLPPLITGRPWNG